ncbi:MAG: 4-hydroxy-3-methylbut-2-enyl diphosphate reductase [Candidatus Ratteibacteria bacterium]|jgi:4-hydroxy-3-methylbut-2-enyl diphosphate reductase
MKQKEQKTIEVSRCVGFCFGVTRAVEKARTILSKTGSLATIGDIVHNPLVMEDLVSRGLQVLTDPSEIKGSPFIIRSHGIQPTLLAEVKKHAGTIHDATCPFVTKVQRMVGSLRGKYMIFLVGDPLHPEIQVLKELAGNNSCVVDPVKNDMILLNSSDILQKAAIVAQTTISKEMFLQAIHIIFQKTAWREIRTFNTICPVSIERQQEAQRLANTVDALIVVGGKKSSNTEKLVVIGKRSNPATFLVEQLSDLARIQIEKFHRFGIISGASTDIRFIQQILSRFVAEGCHIIKK